MFAGWNCLMTPGPCTTQQVDWLRGILGLAGGATVGIVFGFGFLWISERIRHHTP
jgi:hypothetical protein